MNEKVFVLNIASFYKVNLLSRLAAHGKVSAFFLDGSELGRHDDFFKKDSSFSSIYMSNSPLLKRVFVFMSLFLSRRKCDVVLGGWDKAFFWAIICCPLIRRARISLILESTTVESNIKGFRGILKKIFMARVSKVYASGSRHGDLANQLSFKGKVVINCGVGVLEDEFDNILHSGKKNFVDKFLYIGRISEEKNLFGLIDAIRGAQKSIDVIGDGESLDLLRDYAAGADVTFLGYKSRVDLFKFLEDNRYRGLILPSYRETWGLVVEEALAFGIPVIVTVNAGCFLDLVDSYHVGVGLNPWSVQSIIDAIHVMSGPQYNYYKSNAENFSLASKQERYVQSFL